MNVGDVFRFDKTTTVAMGSNDSCPSVYREKWTGVIHMIENREEFFTVRLDGGRMRQTVLDTKEHAVVVPFDKLSANELLTAPPRLSGSGSAMIKTHEYSPDDVFRYNGPSIKWAEESNWTVFSAVVKERADVDLEMGFYIVQLSGLRAFIFTENIVRYSTPIELSDLTADELLCAHPDFFAAVKR